MFAGVSRKDKLLTSACCMCLCVGVVVKDDVCLQSSDDLFRCDLVGFEQEGFDVSACDCGHFPIGEFVCVPKEREPMECVEIWCDGDDGCDGVEEWLAETFQETLL